MYRINPIKKTNYNKKRLYSQKTYTKTIEKHVQMSRFKALITKFKGKALTLI